MDQIEKVTVELFGADHLSQKVQTNVNVALDDFQVKFYERNRDWVAGKILCLQLYLILN